MRKEERPVRQPYHREASAAATAALGTLTYPVSKEEAIRKVGDWKLPCGHGEQMPLARVLEQVPEEQLDDVQRALILVDQHWGRAEASFHGGELPHSGGAGPG